MLYTHTRNVESDAPGGHLGWCLWSLEKRLAIVLVGQRRPDNFYQQKRGIHKTLSGNKPDSNNDSTRVHRQLTTEYPSFPGLPSARLLDYRTGQTALWVFLLGFPYPRSRTGLCARTRILLFPHHSSLFYTTTIYLPHLFWHVSRIRNHLHVVELRKPIGWCHDGDSNVNGEHRKSHSASHPPNTKRGSHAVRATT